jgi:hypothetical protein
MLDLLAKIGAGAVSGAFIALLGYAKSATVESFDPAKAAQTVVVGAVVGGIAGEAGMSYEQAQDWASTMGVITLTEFAKKAIWRAIRR